ncbi:hypothetical protein P4O66_002749 [Electrophorus voltai]|uniref:Uncharacterized protein n=1 Tax=Electrophorus voltai TaxID=2609070 RepID=A0AAD9DPL1_9TELE|nr:hypothetical protein P4O66_002749 [Electrophorus voltai]
MVACIRCWNPVGIVFGRYSSVPTSQILDPNLVVIFHQPPHHRNIVCRRMPGRKSKKNKKGKKAQNRSSPALMGKSSICLSTLSTATTGESAPGKFWGSPGCSSGEDSAEPYRPLTEYENWYKGDQYPGPESAGSNYPYWDYWKSYGEYE